MSGIRHGTRYVYVHYKCRCDECRKANREYGLRAKEQRKLGPMPERLHGTPGGYTNWDCRCDECAASHSVQMRRQYAARLARRATA